jgi:hypothetical protein
MDKISSLCTEKIIFRCILTCQDGSLFLSILLQSTCRRRFQLRNLFHACIFESLESFTFRMSPSSSLLTLDCRRFYPMSPLALSVFWEMLLSCSSIRTDSPIQFQLQFIRSISQDYLYFLENHQLKRHLTSFVSQFTFS